MRKALCVAVLAAGLATIVAATAATGASPGFKTTQGPMIDPVAAGASYEPIITVGDTLSHGYRFESIPDGISFVKNGKGTVDLYVNHETSTVPFPYNAATGVGFNDFTNAMVSKLRLSQRSGGVLQGSLVIPSEANFQRFCSNFIATKEHGFSRPILFTNEEATDFVYRTGQAWPTTPGDPAAEQAGLVVAYDVRNDTYKGIYGMGRHNHENAVAIPGYGQPVVLSGDDTFTSNPAQSQLYSYIAKDADAVWHDDGDLYGLVLDDAAINDYYDFPVGTTMSQSGTFEKIAKEDAVGDQTKLEAASDALNVFQFVRVEDIAYDRRPHMQNVIYVADSGRGLAGPTGPGISTNGRIWKLVLDPSDPTKVLSLSILIEGDDASVKAPGEIHQPDNLETTAKSLLVTEDPGSSQQFFPDEANATTARIWQYDLESGTQLVAAKVNQSADGGPTDVGTVLGKLGAWESSGIIDAASVFGPGAFLVDVQAGTLVIDEEVRGTLTYQRDGGQLGLLRIPGA
ncbi:MAG: PhoX family protein [Gaiellaceae bacterium MAG52_C11]|nr:PhoX family protein [Candidatus Gaiellasilicea maunaloa]